MKKKILLVDDEPDFFYNPERIRTQEDQIQMICGLKIETLQWVLYVIFAIKHERMVVI